MLVQGVGTSATPQYLANIGHRQHLHVRLPGVTAPRSANDRQYPPSFADLAQGLVRALDMVRLLPPGAQLHSGWRKWTLRQAWSELLVTAP